MTINVQILAETCDNELMVMMANALDISANEYRLKMNHVPKFRNTMLLFKSMMMQQQIDEFNKLEEDFKKVVFDLTNGDMELNNLIVKYGKGKSLYEN